MDDLRAWKAMLCGFALCALPGCYNYEPIRSDVAPVGEAVRLRVTRDGARQLADVTEVLGAAPELRGRIVGRQDQDLLVSVPVARRQDGMHVYSLSQTVRVPTREVLSIERREFDGIRTTLLIAGGTAAATGLLLGVIEAFGRLGGDGDDPDPDFSVSLFSIPIG